MISNEEFFDEASLYYNDMVNFDQALVKRQEALKNIISSEMKSAADIGCGTGLDSLSLAKNGLDVTAFDLSGKMLEQASAKAKEKNLSIQFVKSSADKIPDEYNNKFSFVVSLGNTFANLNPEQAAGAIKKCFNILMKDGVLLIQMLNFSRILKDKERIINITRSNNFYFTRFYDFINEGINFNILKFNAENTKEHQLITTKLYPHEYQLITKHLKEAGFAEIKLWDNFNRKLFEPASSKDLIIEAIK